MKEIRLNANETNSVKFRRIQREYEEKHFPAKLSLETLCNLGMDLGHDALRAKLNLPVNKTSNKGKKHVTQ